MAIECAAEQREYIELRQQAHYWRAQHARAIEREAAWKEKALYLETRNRQQEEQIKELSVQVEALKAKILQLQQQLFGRKSEQTKDADSVGDDVSPEASGSPQASGESQRPRGKQPGAKGHGRRRRTNLPTEKISHDLPDSEKRCPKCGKLFDPFPGTEDSDEIHWEVRIVRRVHKRRRYTPTCDCGAVPGIVTAPVPPKLIPKGMCSVEFWTQLLLEKFLFQRPLNRIRTMLALEGFEVSQGTLTGGLKRIGELLQPIYTRILERNRAAHHWQMDETRWMVFVEVEGKANYRWWLWVVVTGETCAYLIEPTRSAEVPRTHLGEHAEGILNADRYSAYKALLDMIRIAFCWSHIRRDFLRVWNSHRKLRSWADEWVTRINDLFHQNARRLQVLSDPDAFSVEDHSLRELIGSMEATIERELVDESLHPTQRKVLESLCNHWDGATIFVDHPEIPMDNNECERRLRNPVIGRNNYYGSGSIWSGMLTAVLFTIFQTLIKNSIDPKKWLLSYLQACAEHKGRAPDDEILDGFLPWNLSDQRKLSWQFPGPET